MFDNLRNTLNFDDLLFEKRNKEYGAFQLRKKYNAVVFASIIISTLIFSLAIILPFSIKPRNEKVFNAGYSYVPVQMEQFEPPQEVLVPPSAPPPPPAKIEEVVAYVPPVITDSIIPITSTLPTADQLETIPVNENSDFSGSGSGDDQLGIIGGEPSDDPFFVVEIMPSFRGGDVNRFRDWVMKRTNFPQEAIDKKIKGKVVITFIVETDGTVSNVEVVQSVDPIIDNEAVKTIQASPKWTPGLQRGQPVRVRYLFPINFMP
jgi:protein TonB